MKRLLMGIATVATVATAAHAQAPFADVPRDHWAYEAVNTLATRGLIIGYPDGTFGGKRAMTRYEFAVVIARMIPQLEDRIRTEVERAVGDRPTQNTPPPDLSNYVTRDDFDRLSRLVDQFAPELQMLQVNVAEIRRDLNDLRGRVATLEEEAQRISIHGELSVINRHSALEDATLDRGAIFATSPNGFSGRPTDLNGRPLNMTTNLLESMQVLYDLNLGISARVNKSVNAHALLNIGNYAGGFASSPVFAGAFGGTPPFDRPVFPYGSTTLGSLNANISPLKAYIETPVSLGPLGLFNLEVGKTGIQYTPYTLKLVDYDDYTNISYTDNGDVIFTGIKGKFRVGGVGFSAHAGTHGTALTSGGPNEFGNFASGAGYPVLFTGGVFSPNAPFAYDADLTPILTVPEALFGGRPDLGLEGLPFLYAPATQSAGVRATLGTPFGGTLGLTYMNAGINNADFSGATGPNALPNVNPVDVGRAQVYGADLALNLSRGLGITAEYANSNLFERGHKFTVDNDENSLYARDLKEAYDVRATFGLRSIALSAGYKKIHPFFGAPGAWGSIGRWKNPTNIEGWVGTIGIPLTRGLAFAGSAEQYNSIVSGVGPTMADVLRDDDSARITRWTAGLKFNLTSANRVDLGVEHVKTRAGDVLRAAQGITGSPESEETFYNFGIGSALSQNTSFKVLYQIIDYRDKGARLLNNGQDARGSVAVGQFTVKF